MNEDEALAQRLVAHTPPDLLDWFAARGLCRSMVIADVAGTITEIIAPPVLLLGPAADEVRACPHPDRLEYPVKRLAEMDLNDYHIFLLRWFNRAVDAGICRCMTCKKVVTNTDITAPWDGIFVDKELVACMVNHFDCKRGLQRELKGRHPFELIPQAPERFDVSQDEGDAR